MRLALEQLVAEVRGSSWLDTHEDSVAEASAVECFQHMTMLSAGIATAPALSMQKLPCERAITVTLLCGC